VWDRWENIELLTNYYMHNFIHIEALLVEDIVGRLLKILRFILAGSSRNQKIIRTEVGRNSSNYSIYMGQSDFGCSYWVIVGDST
jgi:hypothetical protein